MWHLHQPASLVIVVVVPSFARPSPHFSLSLQLRSSFLFLGRVRGNANTLNNDTTIAIPAAAAATTTTTTSFSSLNTNKSSQPPPQLCVIARQDSAKASTIAQ
ncbi:hypothetical protein CSUB01_06529 [Colletotrichum sublineola]|uniref:Secreted protein n=1 Tax=Colletotrichum sublineola TaxID=1173701 RepID=A0A066X9R3_COLSU|nr:hypothetical protein CSUB01_06529 [Colletotrichum sublineola]